jgi:succinate dehydrogenase / fumarate reductase iron-sulfur subunit
MKFTLKLWRQNGENDSGRFETRQVDDISPDASFLEMLDVVNSQVEAEEGDAEPFSFASDCREGICGTCCLTINGHPHGPGKGKATCQVYMREFRDGETITIEPFRATAFPVIKDCVVDRSSLDRIIESGGYISVSTGSAPDANAIPVSKEIADKAFDAATCIGCGACVAACKNASAMLFTSAKVSHLNMLPQGKPEKTARVLAMVNTMDEQGFGNCTNEGECEAACPKGISISNIARMNREYIRAKLFGF